ncbi:DUF6297 family protein [Kineococcus sp. SYSU DK004]|uniref:DUF6297 family protein n=1 Tax=Kineococcus sp. SYSU DK004 TaxID=3383125 RepID=UPI003D7E5C1A
MSARTDPVAVLPGPAAGAALPTRRDLVRDASPARALRGLRTALTDTYTTVLEVGIATLLLLGASSSLRQALQRGLAEPAAGPGPVTSTSAVAAAAGLAVAAVLMLLAALCRLGPVSLPAAPTTWWTPLPVAREALLRPVVRRRAAALAAAGALTCAWAASVALGATGTAGAGAVVAAVAGAAVLGAALATGGLALLLPVLVRHPARASTPRLLRRAAALDAAAAALVVLLAVSAAAAVPVASVPPGALAVPAAAAALAALVALAGPGRRAHRDAARTPAAALRRGSARLTRLTASVLQLDLREVGRALAADGPSRVRSARPVGRRAPRVRGPLGAVLAADLLLLRRQPRRPATAAALALVPLVVAAATAAHPGVVALLLWAAGYAAATTLSEPARSAVLVPAAVRALPVDARAVLLVRLLPVAVLCALWGALAVPLAATTSGLVTASGPTAWWAWALLGALAGPGWAAAALRGALRPDPDLSRPQVVTAMGAVPTAAVAAVSTGPDLAVLATLPLLLALLAGGAVGLVVEGQVLATLAAVAIGWGYAAARARAREPRAGAAS